MKERPPFKIGDRVKLSAEGLRQGFGTRSRHNKGFTHGSVRGFGHHGLIRVQPDGHKTVGSWHPDFWELAEGS